MGECLGNRANENVGIELSSLPAFVFVQLGVCLCILNFLVGGGRSLDYTWNAKSRPIDKILKVTQGE
jgi:hypothetical protein